MYDKTMRCVTSNIQNHIKIPDYCANLQKYLASAKTITQTFVIYNICSCDRNGNHSHAILYKEQKFGNRLTPESEIVLGSTPP